MRKKVYGKRGRAPAIQFSAFIDSSPVAAKPIVLASSTQDQVLKERSNNARNYRIDAIKNTSFSGVEYEKPLNDRSKTAQQDAKRSQSADTEPSKHHHRSWGKREDGSETSDPSTLADQLQQKLAISDTNEVVDDRPGKLSVNERAFAISTPPEPVFQRRTAVLDAEITLYISPLLACKAISGRVESFQAWTDERAPVLDIKKIGEGSFGEVYRATSSGKTAIIKIMPLNAKKGRGSRSYTSIEAASTEVRVLDKMQKVPGFVEFRGGCVLVGTMPQQFVSEWNEYKSSGRTVESKDPNKKDTYPNTQLWLVIEMSDAGTNLNPGQYLPPGIGCGSTEGRYLSVKRTWDIFWQIVRAIAKAEIYAEFEHRDLHLGNICALDTKSMEDEEDLTLVARDGSTAFSLNNTGVQATIIDYSLSRATVTNDQVLFFDFTKNDSLLKGQGDLQYDVYRYMADAVGQKSCREFVPVTNVMWLSHLITKLLWVTHELSEEARQENEDCITATAKMRAILQEVERLLVLEDWRKWKVNSAGDVLARGTRKGWFCISAVLES